MVDNTGGISMPADEEFDYADYDVEDDKVFSLVTGPDEALPYPDVEANDDLDTTTQDKVLGFTNVFGRTPEEAIAIARSWCLSGHWCGVGMCLATVRQYYGVPSGFPTAASSYWASDHKRFVRSGRDVPRGVPVYWTGGSHGAGHIAISVGGGVCLSTDWKSAGKISYAHIDDITAAWGLQFKGYTWEVNGRQVWAPAEPKPTVRLANLKPGQRNKDVLEVKQALHKKGYTGFLTKSNKWGSGVQRAYAKYQRRLGYSGKDANGIPGRESLRKLGFRVVH